MIEGYWPRGRERKNAIGETISINNHPTDPLTVNLDEPNLPNGASVSYDTFSVVQGGRRGRERGAQLMRKEVGDPIRKNKTKHFCNEA